MILTRIELENWMAFGGLHKLELPPGAIAVVARYADNPRRSNWAGKTAFLEAIEWALFGVHRKRYDDDLITYGAESTRVRLAFSDGSVVERSKTRGKATHVTLHWAGKSATKKAAETEIPRLLGYDASDYRATVCFAQGDTEAIVEKRSADRRKVVTQWLELDAWVRVAARARAHARVVTERHQTLRAELSVRQRDQAGVDPEEVVARIDTQRRHLEGVRVKLFEVERALENVAQAEIRRQDEIRLQALGEQAAELRPRLVGVGVQADLEKARGILSTTEAALQRATEEHDTAAGLARGDFDGVCPVTCEDCPVAEDVRANHTAAVARLSTAAVARREAYGARGEASKVVRDMESREREATRLRERYNGILAEGRRLKEAIEARADAPTVTDAQLAELRRSREDLRAVERETYAGLQAMDRELTRYQEAETWIRETATELEAVSAEIRAANLALRAVGASGIPAAIAETALDSLEERANALLSGTGLSFAFGWDRATKTVAPVCDACGYAYRGTRDKSCPACDEPRGMKRSDELEILVNDGTAEPEDVKAKSGGARVLVAASIRLAAGLMIRERRGARATFAAVDEPFGALDAENRETLARTFAGMLSAVGLEQAFVVSHDAALLDALPARIEITRTGDLSRVEMRR